jgi:hypothetical protein
MTRCFQGMLLLVAPYRRRLANETRESSDCSTLNLVRLEVEKRLLMSERIVFAWLEIFSLYS